MTSGAVLFLAVVGHVGVRVTGVLGAVRDELVGPPTSGQDAQLDEPLDVPSSRPSGAPRHPAVVCCRQDRRPAADEECGHRMLASIEAVFGSEFLQSFEVTEGGFEGQPFDGCSDCGRIGVIAREVAAGQRRLGEVLDVGFQEWWQSIGRLVGRILRDDAGAFLLGADVAASALRGKGEPFGARGVLILSIGKEWAKFLRRSHGEGLCLSRRNFVVGGF